MKFLMNITQEIINEGKCRSVSGCAFALAYNNLIPRVAVGSQMVHFYDRDRNPMTEIYLTLDQSSFIRHFDAKGYVAPTQFEVEIPDKVIEYWYGDIAKVAEKIANSKVLTALPLEVA